LRINGADHALVLEPQRILLDVLRNDLHLTGTKKVCDMGDCGAYVNILRAGRIAAGCGRVLVAHICLSARFVIYFYLSSEGLVSTRCLRSALFVITQLVYTIVVFIPSPSAMR
jgi:xanthine dehydrogenase iron-sulfur cluster and FAD-binding subunit A